MINSWIEKAAVDAARDKPEFKILERLAALAPTPEVNEALHELVDAAALRMVKDFWAVLEKSGLSLCYDRDAGTGS